MIRLTRSPFRLQRKSKRGLMVAVPASWAQRTGASPGQEVWPVVEPDGSLTYLLSPPPSDTESVHWRE